MAMKAKRYNSHRIYGKYRVDRTAPRITHMNFIIPYIRQSLEHRYSPEELKSLTMIICRDILELNTTDIYLNREIYLSEEKRGKLINVIERLQRNEPIQYIRGTADFFGMSFCVTPAVLIPRPETEELVELVIKENPSPSRILDIGTGSGCIAISLAKNMPQAMVSAWDISEEALSVARYTNDRQGTNVTFYNKDVLNLPWCKEKYDIIVSNPPYITEDEKKDIVPRILDWEPSIALFVPNQDPLRFYRCIARLGIDMLSGSGKLYFEINRTFGKDIVRMLEELHYQNIRILKDLFKNDRFITAER
ncbi:Release factor glutamine methyltransferase [termite gut metagenome]|uniref:peptide chain release factor N(5)-glutamine methyltransferase n=1 Tax=termite gut metagenome TaxID=433724 RepID=A0A5J4QW16_9ZZZZ